MDVGNTEKLLKRILDETLPCQRLQLLRMTISPSLTQGELDSFLADWAIENSSATGALQMTFLMEAHPHLTYPDNIIEELDKHLGFYKMEKSDFRANIPVILKTLSDKGISASLFKGGEMLLHRPSTYLEMRDVDVIVKKEDWKKAAREISSLGYEIINWDRHSFDAHVKGNIRGLIDVHRYLPPVTGKEDRIVRSVLSRAQDVVLWDVSCKALCPEDLVFTYLGNIYRNIVGCRRPQSVQGNIVNIGYILKHNDSFDWQIVIDDAVRTDAAPIYALVAGFVNMAVPGLMPEEMLNLSGDLSQVSDTVAFRRYVLCHLQAKSHGLGVKTVLLKPSLIPAFLKIRPLYTALKRFKSSPKVARLMLAAARRFKHFSV